MSLRLTSRLHANLKVGIQSIYRLILSHKELRERLCAARNLLFQMRAVSCVSFSPGNEDQLPETDRHHELALFLASEERKSLCFHRLAYHEWFYRF